MAGLVAYEGSSSDESDEETKTEPSINVSDKVNQKGSGRSGILASLPAPHESMRKVDVKKDEELELEVQRKPWEKQEAQEPAKKKLKTTAKIAIPELPNADSDDEEEAKGTRKVDKQNAANVLLSMLPKPKTESNKRIQLPEAKLSKPSAPAPAAFIPRKVVEKPVKLVQKPLEKEENLSDDDEAGDFFSLNKDPALEKESFASANFYDQPGPSEPCSSSSSNSTYGPSRPNAEYASLYSYPDADSVISASGHSAHPSQYYNVAEADLPSTQYEKPVGPGILAELPRDVAKAIKRDEFAVWELEQLRAQKHEPIEILEAKADNFLGNARENLLKGITDEHQRAIMMNEASAKTQKIDRRAKQKHQITYLVQMAKAREAELQYEWAQGKNARVQARQKYGF